MLHSLPLISLKSNLMKSYTTNPTAAMLIQSRHQLSRLSSPIPADNMITHSRLHESVSSIRRHNYKVTPRLRLEFIQQNIGNV